MTTSHIHSALACKVNLFSHSTQKTVYVCYVLILLFSMCFKKNATITYLYTAFNCFTYSEGESPVVFLKQRLKADLELNPQS